MKKSIFLIICAAGIGVLSGHASIGWQSEVKKAQGRAVRGLAQAMYKRHVQPGTDKELAFVRSGVPRFAEFKNNTRQQRLIYRMLVEHILRRGYYQEHRKEKVSGPSRHKAAHWRKLYAAASQVDKVIVVRYINAVQQFTQAKRAGFPDPGGESGRIEMPLLSSLISLGRELFSAICSEIGMKDLVQLSESLGSVLFWKDKQLVFRFSINDERLPRELNSLWHKMPRGKQWALVRYIKALAQMRAAIMRETKTQEYGRTKEGFFSSRRILQRYGRQLIL